MMLYARKFSMKWMALPILTYIILSACGMSAPTSLPADTPPAATETTKSGLETSAAFEPAECPFDVPDDRIVECGFVIVAEDHSNPSVSTIRLAVAVIRDHSEDHQPDPVILLAGGPGEKVVHNTLGLGQVLAPLYPRRDLIVFDQRGVGLSEPALECPGFVEALFDVLDEPDSGLVLQRTYEGLMVCRDQLLEEGIHLEMYNTF